MILNITSIKSSSYSSWTLVHVNPFPYSDRNRASIPSGRNSLIVETIHPWVTEKKQILSHHHPLLLHFNFSASCYSNQANCLRKCWGRQGGGGTNTFKHQRLCLCLGLPSQTSSALRKHHHYKPEKVMLGTQSWLWSSSSSNSSTCCNTANLSLLY